MKIEELRVGSWVEHDGIKTQIKGIVSNPEYIILHGIVVMPADLKPIQYAPLWGQKLVPRHLTVMSEMDALKERRTFLVLESGHKMYFKYVHELQNILISITHQ